MFGYKISSFFLILVLLLSVTNLQAFSTTQLNSDSHNLNGLSIGLIGVAFADDDDDDEDDDNGKDKKEKKEKKSDKQKIKVEIEDGEAEVEIKINGIESELELDTNDLDEILTLIQTITGLSESEIKDIWEIKIEDDDDKDDDEDDDNGKDKKDGKQKIKVEIEDGEAEVEIKINDIKSKLELKNTDLDDILSIIQLITGLSESEIKDIWEVKIEEDDDEDDDEDDHGKKDKVTICHIPPGNPGNAHTISVSGNAENAHLAHGDTLGECPDGDEDKQVDDGQDNTTTITLTKQVTNDNQGTAGPDDFMISVNGTIVLSGSTTEVAPNVLFAINETAADGYEFVEITGDPECPTILDDETITLAPGQDINCIIHNNDEGDATTITLTKQVTNDNQGTAGPDDFMISVNGTIVLSGSTTEVAP
ncbi:MAG: hypothetical protein IH792_04875, partial [Thaumarchaeota archaeon]|nr:hypothetical protein [Nitrososphaerota archaeon]